VGPPPGVAQPPAKMAIDAATNIIPDTREGDSKRDLIFMESSLRET
jgi:hypothetical protein